MSGSAPIIVITEKQQAVLGEFAASRTIAVSLAQRSKIILMAFDRIHNDEIAESVGLNRNQVGVWRHRWKAERQISRLSRPPVDRPRTHAAYARQQSLTGR